MRAISLSITKETFGRVPYYVEETAKHIRECEVENELEGELAELLEEEVAQYNEAGTGQRQARRSGVHRRENPAIVRRQSAADCDGARHYTELLRNRQLPS